MRTARSYRTETPLWAETPWTETPLDRDPLDRDPPVNRITDRCKNITFPQLCLRVVIKFPWYMLVQKPSFLQYLVSGGSL